MRKKFAFISDEIFDVIISPFCSFIIHSLNSLIWYEIGDSSFGETEAQHTERKWDEWKVETEPTPHNS
jgi:hypothetical protein